MIATPERGLSKEKNVIKYPPNWVENQLKNRPVFNVIINIYL